MALTPLEKKERIHGMVDVFLTKLNANTPETRTVFYNIIDTVIEDVAELRETKVERSEIKELIQEMRAGFALMEKRFEAVDKRFEDMQKYMDRRFEDLQRYFDKRFEDFNERFRLMFWFMGAGFTILSILLALFRFIKP